MACISIGGKASDSWAIAVCKLMLRERVARTPLSFTYRISIVCHDLKADAFTNPLVLKAALLLESSFVMLNSIIAKILRNDTVDNVIPRITVKTKRKETTNAISTTEATEQVGVTSSVMYPSPKNKRNETFVNGMPKISKNRNKSRRKEVLRAEAVETDINNSCGCVPESYCSVDRSTNSTVCYCLSDKRIVHPGEPCIRLTVPMDTSNPRYDNRGVINNDQLSHIFTSSNTTDKTNSSSWSNETAVVPDWSSAPLPSNSSARNTAMAIGSATAAIVLLALLVACVVRGRRRPHQAGCWWERVKGHRGIHALAKSAVLNNQLFTNNPNYYSSSPDAAVLKALGRFEIEREKLTFVDEIGEGCFGKVYRGVFVKSDVEVMDVAVKILKDGATNEAHEDFVREVEIMSSFDHKNILHLLGVVVKDTGPAPWMVFEYMEYGDLAELLRSNSPFFWRTTPPPYIVVKDNLPWIATQVANGMMYLSSQHFVHRDLATRNCLVGRGLSVKISDFGMSRDIYTNDYYKIGGSRMLPVRWMAPESVMYGKFTLESDIWSFGVVLWEIFSFGKQPYYGHSNEEVVKLIRQGILLTPPEDCQLFLCQLMASCWKTNPYDRITFPNILSELMGHFPTRTNTASPPDYVANVTQTVGNDNYLVPRVHSANTITNPE